VHTLCAQIISRRNGLLCISTCERILVVPPFEGACDGHVPVFNVKTTTEAYIPIVVYFIDVGEIQFFAPLLHSGGGAVQCRLHTASCWSSSRWLLCLALHPQMACGCARLGIHLGCDRDLHTDLPILRGMPLQLKMAAVSGQQSVGWAGHRSVCAEHTHVRSGPREVQQPMQPFVQSLQPSGT
jgi:hypothetical protein